MSSHRRNYHIDWASTEKFIGFLELLNYYLNYTVRINSIPETISFIETNTKSIPLSEDIACWIGSPNNVSTSEIENTHHQR